MYTLQKQHFGTQHTTYNTQHNTTQHTTQHTTHNTQHTTHNTTHNTQHTTHNTPHTQWVGCCEWHTAPSFALCSLEKATSSFRWCIAACLSATLTAATHVPMESTPVRVGRALHACVSQTSTEAAGSERESCQRLGWPWTVTAGRCSDSPRW